MDGVKKRSRSAWGSVKKTTTRAMATAVSSGDDLTDFQSQPRFGLRVGLGLQCGRCCCCCAALATLQPIFIFIFILFLYLHSYMFACLSVCPTLSLSHSLFVCSINFAGRSCEPMVTAVAVTVATGRGARQV